MITRQCPKCKKETLELKQYTSGEYVWICENPSCGYQNYKDLNPKPINEGAPEVSLVPSAPSTNIRRDQCDAMLRTNKPEEAGEAEHYCVLPWKHEGNHKCKCGEEWPRVQDSNVPRK